MIRAACTLSLTGPFALQGGQAVRGLEMWAQAAEVELTITDDEGSTASAVEAYRRWLVDDVDLLLGPYGSNLVRRVASLVCGSGRLLWNHGGSADDLARPLLITLLAPASTYFCGAVELAEDKGLKQVMLVRGAGRFAAAVAAGARARAVALDLPCREMDLDRWPVAGSVADTAVLIVGSFEEDVAVVRSLREKGRPVGLLGCVAAGFRPFERNLGVLAEGVLGPVQWFAAADDPEVGPSGVEFAERYEARFGEPPDYVAAQAAASGYLALEAQRRGYGPDEIRHWRTSTLLGTFALDGHWRQVGHAPLTVQWDQGRPVPAR